MQLQFTRMKCSFLRSLAPSLGTELAEHQGLTA